MLGRFGDLAPHMFRQAKKHFTPPAVLTDPELLRRAELVISFGFTGAVFGSIFILFYLALGHYWGAVLVAVCSLGFLSTPFILRQSGDVTFAGNLYTGIVCAGFLLLTAIEGGAGGHAVAWLATVPLCALLLVDRKSSMVWSAIAIVSVIVFALLPLFGVIVPRFYPPQMHDLITAAGYAALPPFLGLFGYLFETGRRRASDRMQEAALKLSEANAHLLQLNQEKNEFLGIAAHDLKNPLSQISMGADAIKLEDEDPESMVNQCATIIALASERMTNLISNLLDINAIEEGRMNLKQERVEALPLLREVMAFYADAARRKEITIHLETPEHELVVRSDRDATVQVIDNLVSNAIKYSPRDSAVELRLLMENECAVVEIIDHGPGLSEEDQGQLFQKFARLGPRPTAGESSNGLGLSIVKRLAEGMGGSVRCRSEVGAGSTFIVILPLFGEAVNLSYAAS